MSTEENKTVIRRYFDEVWIEEKIEILGELVAENALGHDATSAEPVVGFENVKQVVSLFHKVFPDIQILLHDLIAEGDKVVARWGLRGTHSHLFMGVPASGKTVNVNGIIIFRLEHKKISEYWGSFDTLGLMKQIGVTITTLPS